MISRIINCECLVCLFRDRMVDIDGSISSIYIELADQYKTIDAVSNVAKRNVLAEHLQNVIRVLERKVSFSSLC